MARTFQARRFAALESTAGQAPPFLSPATVSAATMELAVVPDQLEKHVEDAQREMDALRGELNLLRRRDDTLNFYMHRLDEELRLAARLQQDFLPRTLPQIGPIHFHTLFRPAGYVSGDLYDVMRLDEKHIGFYIADAVGHGMPAALLTMFIKHALVTKEIIPGGYRLLRPSESLARLNESILEQNLSQAAFATALYGMINVVTMEVTLACAGHPAPLLLGAKGRVDVLPVQGSLMGVFPGEIYNDLTLQLRPGESLVLYTDGVEVVFSDEPASCDPDRWRKELLADPDLPADQLLSVFAQTLDRETGSLEPRDDLTMIVVEAR